MPTTASDVASPGCGPVDGPPCPCDDDLAARNALLTERNRFFTGKYMSARDFRAEQAYFLNRHRLHHRALHGWGIVVGLDVCPHPNPECRRQGWVVVTPGIAVDPYGREIILNAARLVKLDVLFKDEVRCGCEHHAGKWDKELNSWVPEVPFDPQKPFLLGIQYGEVCIEPAPVLYDDAGCGERMAFNRIQEKPCFRWRDYKQNDGCWEPVPPKDPCNPHPDCDPCEDLKKNLWDRLPDPPCGANGLVPLALCEFKSGAGQVTITKPFDRDSDGMKPISECFAGRRYLPGPLAPHTLTHICHVNWDHGKQTSVDKLLKCYETERAEDETAQNMKGYQYHAPKTEPYVRLTIRLDRPLRDSVPPVESPAPHVGFYRRFFRVRYVDHDGALRPLPDHDEAIIHLSHCRKRLHYDIPYHCLQSMRKGVIDPVIHVSLNCDFLPDWRGRAVDGNHLRGELPTGDGVEGGSFESWFKLDW